MFFHYKGLQFEAKPEKPDALFAMKLQELLGGAYGEMTVAMQYLFQGWNCRMPGKYKDLIMDIGTEELAHVEMIATMIARLLEGAPAEQTASAAAANPMLAAIIGGQNPQHAIVGGGGAVPANSAGYPWNGNYIVASGNLYADFSVNAAAEMQGRLQAVRVYNMTDDPGVREMLKFNIARDTMHQNLWLAALEQLREDGLEEVPVPSGFPQSEEDSAHAYEHWSCSEGTESSEGRWASGPSIDGKGTFTYLADPRPLAPEPKITTADPQLYATALEESSSPGLLGKVKDALS